MNRGHNCSKKNRPLPDFWKERGVLFSKERKRGDIHVWERVMKVWGGVLVCWNGKQREKERNIGVFREGGGDRRLAERYECGKS